MSLDENDDQINFFEALDDFPFFDCADFDQTDRPVSQPDPIQEPDAQKPKLRRRRTLKDDGSVSFGGIDAKLTDSAKKFRFLRNLKEIERETRKFDLSSGSSRLDDDISENSLVTDENNVNPNEEIVVGSVGDSLNEEIGEKSVVTDGNGERVDELNGVDSRLGEGNDSGSNVLFFLASLVVKAIGFQVNVFVSLVTFPLWFLHSLYMFVIDPFHVMRQVRGFFMAKLCGIWGVVYGSVSPLVFEWFKEHKSIFKFGLRFGWGVLYSAYVCVVLVSLLVFAFVIGGFVKGVLVEKPIQMKETLNFDYTKHSPVAFVPIISCPDVSCGTNCREKIETGKFGGSRVIPANHKLQVTVSLTLPESDYNRNLGIFQVRIDLLSADGYALSSSRHHSMLQFRSQPIRLLLIFLKVAPLLAGFYSETQMLNIKFKGLTEREIPTACLRVMIEQRAEFRPGAGIPEVYTASLRLESELPLLKRILWSWRKTIFIWISMTVFTMELLLALLCCTPLILPKTRMRGGVTNPATSLNSSPVQR